MEDNEQWQREVDNLIYRLTTQIQDLRQEINNLRKELENHSHP